MKNLSLAGRVRVSGEDGTGTFVRTAHITWRPDRTAAIVCDMWDEVACVSAKRRATALARRIDEVAGDLRRRGALIIHAPAGCMDFYRHTPGRQRALNAPTATAAIPFDWNGWDSTREAPLPMVVDDSEPCSCDSSKPRCVVEPVQSWTRQIPTIQIDVEDAISDDGQEVFNLLTHHAIDLVLLMGIHANRCILGRPYGIRQMVYIGQRPVLCRDLTDSYHREPGGHREGTDRVIAHIQQYWCPTITSDQLIGGSPLRLGIDAAADLSR